MTTTTKKITYACGHNGDRRLQDGPTQDRLFDQFRAGLCPDCIRKNGFPCVLRETTRLMRLGSFINVAGERQYCSLDDVMKDTPFIRTWNWSGGRNEDSLKVWAILSNGNQVQLDCQIHAGDANNHVPDVDVDAPTIGEQISNMEGVHALIFKRVEIDQNSQEEWEEYLPITPPDWGKLRRRVEDALRKSQDRESLFAIANRLNVRIY